MLFSGFSIVPVGIWGRPRDVQIRVVLDVGTFEMNSLVVPRPNGRLRNRSKSLWKDVQKSMSLLEDIILDVDGT